MRSIAEPVNPKASRIAGLAIRSVTDKSRAKQRCNLDVVVSLRQMETISRIRDGELGVTSIDRVTRKAGVIAKILSAGSAIRAIAIGPAKPRDSHAISGLEFRICFLADLLYAPDNLMAQNQGQLWVRQFAIDDMKISPAYCACRNAH
jgi:hypothetical protein